MKHARILVALVMVLAMTASLFVGCKASVGSAEPAPAAPAAAAPAAPAAAPAKNDKPFAGKTIHILMEDVPDTEYVQSLVPKFTEETGINVEIESISYSTMHEKLAAQLIASTNTYDVMVVDYYWTGEFADAGWMYSLDSFIQRDGFDTSHYLDSILAQNGLTDGVMLQIPFYNYAMCLVYNEKIWNDPELQAAYEKANGTKLTPIDVSVEEYLKEVEFISDYYGKNTLAGLVQQGGRGDPIAMEWLNWFFGLGGDWFDANGKSQLASPTAVKAAELYKEAIEKASPTGAVNFNLDDAQMTLASGAAASMINYNWQLPALNNMQDSATAGQFALTYSPGHSSNVGSWGWAIPHNAADPELSWQFLKWVESFETAKERALLGGAPTRSDVYNDADVLALYPYYSEVSDILNAGIGMPQVKDSNGMIEILGKALSEFVAGEKDAQTALNQVAEFMDNMQ